MEEQTAIKKKVLGRGLSALIPARETGSSGPSAVSAEDSAGIVYLDANQVKPNPHQPREEFNAQSLEELAASIKEKGFIQPILVRKTQQGFELIAGERRLRAAKYLKINKIPAIIRQAKDDESLELSLIENIQRQELNPLEEAQAYQHLISNFNFTQEQISQQVGKARASVANTLRLLKLPAEIQEQIRKGAISFAHGRLLLEIENVQTQKKLAKKIVDKGLSVRELEILIHGKLGRAAGRSAMVKKEPEVLAEEEKLQRALGTKVRINLNRKRGTIVVEFYSLEDLERLLKILKR